MEGKPGGEDTFAVAKLADIRAYSGSWTRTAGMTPHIGWACRTETEVHQEKDLKQSQQLKENDDRENKKDRLLKELIRNSGEVHS